MTCVCVPALSSACMNFTAEAAIIRCVQSWWLEEFLFFLFSSPTEETFAGSLWSKISVWNHKNLFLFMSVWYKQECDKAHAQSSVRRQSGMGMRLRFGKRPCFVLCLNFSLILWTTDQYRHLQLPQHTWRCGIFSYNTVGEAHVEQYPTTPLWSAVSGH